MFITSAKAASMCLQRISKKFPSAGEAGRIFPDTRSKIPNSVAREFWRKPLTLLVEKTWIFENRPYFRKIPIYFPSYREFGVGDGFATDCIHHHAFTREPMFPAHRRIARVFRPISRLRLPASSLCKGRRTAQRQFGAFCLWRPENCFPERGGGAAGDSVRIRQRQVCGKSLERNWDTMVMQWSTFLR
jgi:hypothetical protein